LTQDIPQLVVTEFIKGIQVPADVSEEKHRILWNNGDARAKVMESKVERVEEVNVNGT
jgi:hypothetical protein